MRDLQGRSARRPDGRTRGRPWLAQRFSDEIRSEFYGITISNFFILFKLNLFSFESPPCDGGFNRDTPLTVAPYSTHAFAYNIGTLALKKKKKNITSTRVQGDCYWYILLFFYHGPTWIIISRVISSDFDFSIFLPPAAVFFFFFKKITSTFGAVERATANRFSRRVERPPGAGDQYCCTPKIFIDFFLFHPMSSQWYRYFKNT